MNIVQASKLVQVREAIVEGLKADTKRLPGVQVTAHGGEFGLKDLQRYSKMAPALILAPLRVAAENQEGSVVTTVHWGLVGLTRDTAGIDRHTWALALVDAAMRALSRTFFGEGPLTSTPRGLEAVNEYATELDEDGIALWAHAWSQVIELVDEDLSVPLNTIVARYDLYPRQDGADLGAVIEATDIIDDLQD